MRLVAISALIALLLDQVSKYAVVHGMELARVRAIDVLPPLLNFRYGENRGINFGLMDGDGDLARWVLVVLALLICCAVLWWLRGAPQRPIVFVSAGLLIGGALGNVVDRVFYGYVLDFLNMSCCGIRNPFVFNVGDIFIFAGAIGLVFFAQDKKRA
ncbi:signal peptidase II [Sulfitobacter pseudonitzschiae]|uniref:Lipoprotein signal peptidase n=1 Tax=Pseudosulfitobacter pseudonitzschiae TaxID=1402135 RepID=A0A073J6A2_9RHOB|nr:MULTISPECIES: signal peptidase II [Roseobacteraceae]KEJ97335.1 signal peptidase [Pseudosulfitobacter pseudonitzschiae]MBM1815890.1 signal peptidase II [Pseudosulfitobacter pseudonitzschiae]MBM1832881.1 signal peptidase II [Pseudosulfitobacter pseudonitzschiae]MBM1837749.1 signal peptidase II [Pseudosulfitobacter pseudonitzschiae]MBM1842595.1 signal peptidase II [Pseudosulfitobacter pseudonitzschiae]|tara:strand:- start:273 stop:743 length:471 start_codon:yes stop_codon:yes gene_type:complete